MNYLDEYGPKGKQDLLTAQARSIVENFAVHRPMNAVVNAPFGVGKTTLTRMVTKSIFCKANPSLRPCGGCPNCESVDEQWKSSPTVNGIVSEDGSFEVVDCTMLSMEHVASLRDRITLFANKPEIFVFDEFHRAKPLVQEAFLKILEVDTSCSLMFCFASTNNDMITQPLLQRLHPFVLRKPEIGEFLPLINRIITEKGIRVIDAAAPERLIGLCGRVPRIVLKAMEMVAFQGEGLSLKSVADVISSLKIINEGKK